MPGTERDPDLLELFIAPLQEVELRYFITGSIAATIYGEPRATHDIDLVIALAESQIDSLVAAFPDHSGCVPPPEVLRTEVLRTQRGHFNIIHHGSGLKADFYLAGRHDELHAWAFAHTRTYDIDALRLQLAPPEYVIIRKLEFFREGGSEKHVNDIRAMLRISEELIDRSVIERLVSERGLGREWAEAEDR